MLAHADKLGRRPFHAWARLAPGWTLITDPAADPEHLAVLRASGVRVTVAAAEGAA